MARLVAAFFLFSMAVVLILGAYSALSISRETTAAALANLQSIAALKEETLDAWLQEQERKVLWLSALPEMVRMARILPPGGDVSGFRPEQAIAGLRALLLSATAHVPEFQEILLLSGEGGRVLLSTCPENEGQYRVQDQSFIQGRRGTFVQSIYPSPITLRPTLTISTPLQGTDGRLLAVLVVNLDLEWMDRVVEERAGLGWSGEAYLVDRYNTFVSAQRFGRADFPRGVHSTGIDAALASRNGAGAYSSYRGVRVLGAWRWIAALETALLVEMQEREALAWVWRQTATLLTRGLLLAVLLAVGVYLLALRITRPILRVRLAALRVAAGDLDVQVPVPTRDEIGDLADSFNAMTTRLNAVYRELRSNEEHFRSLIESSGDILAVLSAAGRVRFVSPSAEKILGYRADELEGSKYIRLVHPDDAPRLEPRLWQAKGTPVQAVFRLMHRDGSWRTLEATARSLLAHPAIRGVVANVRDVTERQELEEKLAQARKMEAVGRLAGGVAHDFNNLLTAIIGYAEVLQLDEGLEPRVAEGVREIRKAADRAAALTRQLLAYSRKQILQVRTIDLNRLVRGLREMLQRLIGEHIRLSVCLEPEMDNVSADPNQLEQVILNLAVNARDAMPEGGTLTIATREERPDTPGGGFVLLELSDTGTGMDRQTKEKIFDPFFTTKEVGKGTGLGLAIVLGIVQQSGGSIAVDSEPGRGSTFTIRLPAAPETESTPETEPAVAAIRPGRGSILLVEDEEAVRRMVHTVLVRSGYRVRQAADAAEALRAAENAPELNLLITDLVMPGLNGRQLAAKLLEGMPGLRVLYMSGYTDDQAMHEEATREGTVFLQKPFTPAVLAEKVREILEDGPPRA